MLVHYILSTALSTLCRSVRHVIIPFASTKCQYISLLPSLFSAERLRLDNMDGIPWRSLLIDLAYLDHSSRLARMNQMAKQRMVGQQIAMGVFAAWSVASASRIFVVLKLA